MLAQLVHIFFRVAEREESSLDTTKNLSESVVPCGEIYYLLFEALGFSVGQYVATVCIAALLPCGTDEGMLE